MGVQVNSNRLRNLKRMYRLKRPLLRSSTKRLPQQTTFQSCPMVFSITLRLLTYVLRICPIPFYLCGHLSFPWI